jgi:FkbH-like protein
VIKGVIWDIDNTLLTGTYLESGGQPPRPDAELVAVARELSERGILHALASRNPPEAADYVRQVTGLPFAAAECGWGDKSGAIARIAADLGIGVDTIAFVDDDMMERAQVAAALPQVLVLTPEDAAEAPAWPEFSPAVLTAEGRRRGELYAQRRVRQQEASQFGGSRDEFLRHADTVVRIGQATEADLDRLHELSARTHQFNSVGEPASRDALAAALRVPGQRLAAAWLSDRFGDDGLVGGVVIEGVQGGGVADGSRPWRVPLLMMSCRALGRGVLDALLAWLCAEAAAHDAAGLLVPCVISDANVPLRLALAAAGFRAAGPLPAAGEQAVFARRLCEPLPVLPDWAVTRPAEARP